MPANTQRRSTFATRNTQLCPPTPSPYKLSKVIVPDSHRNVFLQCCDHAYVLKLRCLVRVPKRTETTVLECSYDFVSAVGSEHSKSSVPTGQSNVCRGEGSQKPRRQGFTGTVFCWFL